MDLSESRELDRLTKQNEVLLAVARTAARVLDLTFDERFMLWNAARAAIELAERGRG